MCSQHFLLPSKLSRLTDKLEWMVKNWHCNERLKEHGQWPKGCKLSAHMICECENLSTSCCIYFNGFGNILRGIYWKVSCSAIFGFWRVWYVFLMMSKIYWLSEALKPSQTICLGESKYIQTTHFFEGNCPSPKEISRRCFMKPTRQTGMANWHPWV